MVSGPGGVSGFDSLAFQPQQQIKFRPDPGEPAVRLSAPPSQTAGLVSAQEQRNETRLRTQALLQGNDVIFSKRTFTLGLGPNSPVFNAGLTTIQFREDENGFAPDTLVSPVDNDDENQENTLAFPESEEDEEEETGLLADTEEDVSPLEDLAVEDEEELESEETELDNEDQRLNRNLNLAQLEQDLALRSGDPTQVEETEREINRIEREIEETEQEKKENEQKQLEIRLEELQSTTNQAIEETLEAALGVIGVLFGIDSGEDQQEDGNPLPSAP